MMGAKVAYGVVARQMSSDIDYVMTEAYHDGYDSCKKEMQKQIDEAYQKGLDDSAKVQESATDAAYQCGLNEAWDAAREIACDEELDMNTLLHIFNTVSLSSIFGDFSASEAIERLKAYEEQKKADEPIKVGDIVDWSGEKYIVTYIDDTDGCVDLLFLDAGSTCERVSPDCFTRTGRHFDIDKILEEMKHED